MWVCQKCQYHFRIKADEYLNILLNDGSFEEFNREFKSADPLGFKAKKKYTDQIEAAVTKTGKKDVLITGVGKINQYEIVLGIMDFSFIGGSMGSVVGEKLARAIDAGIEHSSPLVIISSSGGARMQEGVYSLMQMAKTSSKLARYKETGGIYISLLTDPTTGGVTASYGMQGDIILAEPGALIGFAGPRVIKQTIGQDLPDGFQTAEFLLDKGFIDHIVHRKELKQSITSILDFAVG
jgi:acetyl-CoA carboxylase carboxyl transferase subunit beta